MENKGKAIKENRYHTVTGKTMYFGLYVFVIFDFENT